MFKFCKCPNDLKHFNSLYQLGHIEYRRELVKKKSLRSIVLYEWFGCSSNEISTDELLERPVRFVFIYYTVWSTMISFIYRRKKALEQFRMSLCLYMMFSPSLVPLILVFGWPLGDVRDFNRPLWLWLLIFMSRRLMLADLPSRGGHALPRAEPEISPKGH